MKQGIAQRKRSLEINKDDAVKLLYGEYDCLLQYQNDFTKECYVLMSCELYKPKAMIQYQRLAFVQSENTARVTFDFDIESTESNLDLFDRDASFNPVLEPSLSIMECKYNGFLLSSIQRCIDRINQSTISSSKYVKGRMVCL